MRKYETIVILDSDLSEEQRAPVFERITSLFPQYNGLLIGIDEWGVKKLAYEIKKKPRGYYALINFCGHGDLIDEMERYFRIDDKILKFMTVLLEENVDVEAIKEEIAEKERLAAEAAAQAEKEKSAVIETETADAPVDAEAIEKPTETADEPVDAEANEKPTETADEPVGAEASDKPIEPADEPVDAEVSDKPIEPADEPVDAEVSDEPEAEPESQKETTEEG
jgi:small subunit ribosomal protein S6